MVASEPVFYAPPKAESGYPGVLCRLRWSDPRVLCLVSLVELLFLYSLGLYTVSQQQQEKNLKDIAEILQNDADQLKDLAIYYLRYNQKTREKLSAIKMLTKYAVLCWCYPLNLPKRFPECF